jgi:hypothetical protein
LRRRAPNPAEGSIHVRQSLEHAADFTVANLGDNVVDIVPAEGAGAMRRVSSWRAVSIWRRWLLLPTSEREGRGRDAAD